MFARCDVCPGKCDVDHHVNEGMRWVNKQVEETQTLNDVREKYEDARQKKLSAEELVRELQMEVDELEDKTRPRRWRDHWLLEQTQQHSSAWCRTNITRLH